MDNIKSKHLFVAGPSRSGTTLLELVLSSHPEITITPETYFIQSAFFKKLPTNKSLTKEQWKWILEQMKADKKLASWPNFCVKTFIEKLSEEKNMKLSELLDKLFIEFAKVRGGGTTYIGNKRGIYATYGLYTKQLFLDAKFIYIFRDPRDSVISMMKNIKNHTLQTAIDEYRRVFKGVMKMKVLYPKEVFILKYEELVLNPKKTCEEICQFLNIKFDEKMLYFYKFNKNGKALLSVTKKIHQNTLKPFDPSLIEKWKKNNIDKKFLNMIEVCTKECMDYFSYKLTIQSAFIKNLIIWLNFYFKTLTPQKL